MRRGDIIERADVNYAALSLEFDARLASPRFPLLPIRKFAAFVQYGTSDRATEEEIGLPVLRMSNLQNDGWDLSELKYIELNPVEMEHYRLEQGDILFNRTNSKDLVGKCEVFREEGHWVFASYLIRLRVELSQALPDFVSDFLSTQAGRLQINRISRQIVGMSNINAQELRDLVVPLPPLETQRELVSQLDAAREQRRARLEQAEALLASLDGFLLDALKLETPVVPDKPYYAVKVADAKLRFDPFYHAPHLVEVTRALEACVHPKFTLAELSEPPVGGATPKRSDETLYADGGVKFLRILNVGANEIKLDNLKFIAQDVHQGELERSQLQADDVLMTITGRVGTAAVVTSEILPANINQHIVALRLKHLECLPEYLTAFLNTSFGQTLSNRSVSGGTRIALDYSAIRAIPIPIPPLDVQTRIADEVRARRERARELRADAEAAWNEAKARFEAALLG